MAKLTTDPHKHKIEEHLYICIVMGWRGHKCVKCEHKLIAGEITGWDGINDETIECQQCLGDKVLKYAW